jgi:hypothetical protein
MTVRYSHVAAFVTECNQGKNGEWKWAASVDIHGIVSLSCAPLDGSGHRPTLVLHKTSSIDWMYGPHTTLHRFISVDKFFVMFVSVARQLRHVLRQNGEDLGPLRIT